VVSTYIDSNYTALHSFTGHFALSEPVKIRSVVDLDAKRANVYMTIGSAAEFLAGQVDLSESGTNWDSMIYAAQNNQTDWGASDFAIIDYLKVRKLAVDRYHLWVNRLDWSGETSQAAKDDPDNDGIANFLEYALGGNPLSTDEVSLLPNLVDFNGAKHYEFTLAVDSIDLKYTLKHSTDLIDWDSLSPTFIHGQVGQVIRIPLLDESFERRFSRLEVDQN
jgi:hypothetical protein